MYEPGWSFATTAVVGVCMMGIAAAVFFRAPGRAMHRVFGAFVFLEGVNWAADGISTYLPTNAWRNGAEALEIATNLVLPPIYLLFIGYALDNAWSRPFARNAVRVLLLAAIGINLGAFFVIRHTTSAPFWADAFTLVGVVEIAGASLLGTLAALWAFRGAPPGGLARARAGAYLVAFLARDFGWFVIVPMNWAFEPNPVPAPWVYVGWTLLGMVFVASLAYGLLRFQLLDFDLRVRWTIKHGTLAAAFLAFTFALSEGIAVVLANRTGSVLLGITLAAIVVFFAAPLHTWAERAARRAVPRVGLNPRARAEFYREQVRLAWRDRRIGAKERALLRSVRERLGLSRADAGRVELEVTGG